MVGIACLASAISAAKSNPDSAMMPLMRKEIGKFIIPESLNMLECRNALKSNELLLTCNLIFTRGESHDLRKLQICVMASKNSR